MNEEHERDCECDECLDKRARREALDMRELRQDDKKGGLV